MHKFGREFAVAVMENKDNCVSERVSPQICFFPIITFDRRSQVTKKLTFLTPPPELVDAYLAEIAKGYGVNWAAPSRADKDDDNSSDEGGLKVGH